MCEWKRIERTDCGLFTIAHMNCQNWITVPTYVDSMTFTRRRLFR